MSEKKPLLPKPFGALSSEGKFLFGETLSRARIIRRPNRFIVEIELEDGTLTEAHCPTTGSIGGWEISGLNCLISGPYLGRRTTHTLEALEVPLANGGLEMVGINQNAANRYVESSILTGQLEEALGPVRELKRERKLGSARIDFNVDDEEFIEVKTPLKTINLANLVPQKRSGYGSTASPASTDRLLKHVRELTSALDDGQKAILLTCFIYEAPTFNPPPNSAYSELTEALSLARSKGLESWQANYAIDMSGVSLTSLRALSLGA